MRRREFIAGLGGVAAACPVVARAQQLAMPVIGFLGATMPETNADLWRGFHHGLKETGHVEGDNVLITYRWAENRLEQLPELAADLVRRGGHRNCHDPRPACGAFRPGRNPNDPNHLYGSR